MQAGFGGKGERQENRLDKYYEVHGAGCGCKSLCGIKPRSARTSHMFCTTAPRDGEELKQVQREWKREAEEGGGESFGDEGCQGEQGEHFQNRHRRGNGRETASKPNTNKWNHCNGL
jgi:hypothetical protein